MLDDIILPGASEDELRAKYGPDADAVIAFRRFLALPHEPPDGEGVAKWLCPQHWYDYAVGRIDSAEVLRIDDEVASREGHVPGEGTAATLDATASVDSSLPANHASVTDCGHDGWTSGCPACEANEAAAVAAMEARRGPTTEGEGGT